MKKIIRAAAKPINAAETSAAEALDDKLKTLSDDFEYAIDGLNKLARSGPAALQQAEIIAEQLQTDIQSIVTNIAESISE